MIESKDVTAVIQHTLDLYLKGVKDELAVKTTAGNSAEELRLIAGKLPGAATVATLIDQAVKKREEELNG